MKQQDTTNAQHDDIQKDWTEKYIGRTRVYNNIYAIDDIEETTCNIKNGMQSHIFKTNQPYHMKT